MNQLVISTTLSLDWALNSSIIGAILIVVGIGVDRVFKKPAISHLVCVLTLATMTFAALQSLSRVALSVMVPESLAGLSANHLDIATGSESTSIVLTVVWVLGSLTMSAFMLASAKRVRTILQRRGRYDLAATRLASGVVNGMNSESRSPDVWLVDAIVAPMLYCPIRQHDIGGKGIIVFPKKLWQTLDDGQRRVLLRHELIHWLRRDALIRATEIISIVVMWWNPLIWIAKRQIENYEERCCDAAVTEGRPKERRIYAEAILRTLDFVCEPFEKDKRDVRARPLASALGPLPRIELRLREIIHPACREQERNQAYTTRQAVFEPANRLRLLTVMLGFFAVIWLNPQFDLRPVGAPAASRDVNELRVGSQWTLESGPRFDADPLARDQKPQR